MPSRNDVTGDELISKPLSKKGQENHKKIFGDKPVQRGSWVFDSETKKLVPKGEYREVRKAPDIYVDNMEPYDSPISGKVIRNRRERDRDLKENGCRPYEGLASEQREAQKYRQYEDSRLMSSMMDTAARTEYEIRHGYRNPK